MAGSNLGQDTDNPDSAFDGVTQWFDANSGMVP
jgi:hypothetical protein